MVGFLRRYKETCRNPQKYLFPVHLAEGVVNQYFMLRSNKFNPKVSVSDATPAIYIGSSMILKLAIVNTSQVSYTFTFN